MDITHIPTLIHPMWHGEISMQNTTMDSLSRISSDEGESDEEVGPCHPNFNVFMVILHPNQVSEDIVILPFFTTFAERKNNTTFADLRHVIEDELDHLPPFRFIVNGGLVIQPNEEKEWNFNRFGTKGRGRLSNPFYIYIKSE